MTSSRFIPPIGSTPRNPASLTIFILSRMEPLTPTVLHMIAFLIWRCFAKAETLPNETAASVTAEVWRKLRRVCAVFMILVLTQRRQDAKTQGKETTHALASLR